MRPQNNGYFPGGQPEAGLKYVNILLQVNLRQPSARYEEIHNFSEIGKDYSYCFVVFTQGSTAVSASSLADTSEEGAQRSILHC